MGFGFAQPLQRRIMPMGGVTPMQPSQQLNPAADPGSISKSLSDIKTGLSKIGLTPPPTIPAPNITAPAMPPGAGVEAPSASIGGGVGNVADALGGAGSGLTDAAGGAGDISDLLAALFM